MDIDYLMKIFIGRDLEYYKVVLMDELIHINSLSNYQEI